MDLGARIGSSDTAVMGLTADTDLIFCPGVVAAEDEELLMIDDGGVGS